MVYTSSVNFTLLTRARGLMRPEVIHYLTTVRPMTFYEATFYCVNFPRLRLPLGRRAAGPAALVTRRRYSIYYTGRHLQPCLELHVYT